MSVPSLISAKCQVPLNATPVSKASNVSTETRPQAAQGTTHNLDGFRVSREGAKNEKTLAPKAWRDLRKSSKKALKLFSSFLRGASCPKSPRFKPLRHVKLAIA